MSEAIGGWEFRNDETGVGRGPAEQPLEPEVSGGWKSVAGLSGASSKTSSEP